MQQDNRPPLRDGYSRQILETKDLLAEGVDVWATGLLLRDLLSVAGRQTMFTPETDSVYLKQTLFT